MVEIARVFPQRGRKRERRTGPAAVIAAWIGTTLLAVLAGGIFGLQIETIAEQPKREQDEVNTSRPVTPAPAYSESGRIRALPPVVTKLAGERDAWVRIEASIVLAGSPAEEEEIMAARMAEDMAAFLQTVSVSDIEGPSGFLQLREDLAERARIRSDGGGRAFIVPTVIVD